MTLRLTNTLTRAKADFVPLREGKVSVYCCGVTVYDLCHLGHARSYIVWDVLRRYLIWLGYQVTFVQNYTDIDDKILARAAAEGSSMEAVSERNIEAFVADMAALNILPADRMPRATRSLDAIRSLIGDLEARGAAYSVDGDVYFAVLKHRDYGKLSGRDLADQQDNASGRVATVEKDRKHHPFDFALWKGAKAGEPSFPSPWGPGRPGWHIECSAMVREELGDTIDIHLGGADLIFPHHENEIAQSEAATGKELARWWLHNGMVNVGGEKMSKSLGNFTTIRALLESGVSPMTLRLFVLQAHYRTPLDFTAKALKAAAVGWKEIQTALDVGVDLDWCDSPSGPSSPALPDQLKVSRHRFIDAMNDDLNTSAALVELFDLAKPLRGLANRVQNGEEPSEQEKADLEPRWRLLVELATEVLGFTRRIVKNERPNDLATEQAVWGILANRYKAKIEKNYDLADRLRDELLATYNVAIYDKPAGITTANGGQLNQIVSFDPASLD